MWRLIICSFLIFANVCHGFSPVRPKRHDVFSPNKQNVLDVNPKTERHNVYAVKDRTTPLWTFSQSVGLGPFFLSDDGKIVVRLAWEFVGVEDLGDMTCIQFRNKDGVFKSYTFAELCPNPARPGLFEPSPAGSFWRKWYYEAEQEPNSLRLQTSDLYEYTFSFADGSILGKQLVPSNFLGKFCFFIFLALGVCVIGLILLSLRKVRKANPSGKPNLDHSLKLSEPKDQNFEQQNIPGL